MISPPNNPQPVIFNINNTHGNNYVNHGVRSQTPETTGEECAQAGHVLAPMSPLREAQKAGEFPQLRTISWVSLKGTTQTLSTKK